MLDASREWIMKTRPPWRRGDGGGGTGVVGIGCVCVCAIANPIRTFETSTAHAYFTTYYYRTGVCVCAFIYTRKHSAIGMLAVDLFARPKTQLFASFAVCTCVSVCVCSHPDITCISSLKIFIYSHTCTHAHTWAGGGSPTAERLGEWNNCMCQAYSCPYGVFAIVFNGGIFLAETSNVCHGFNPAPPPWPKPPIAPGGCIEDCM